MNKKMKRVGVAATVALVLAGSVGGYVWSKEKTATTAGPTVEVHKGRRGAHVRAGRHGPARHHRPLGIDQGDEPGAVRLAAADRDLAPAVAIQVPDGG